MLDSNSRIHSCCSQVRGLCKQFKGDVYLTARDEARGKVDENIIFSEVIFGFFWTLFSTGSSGEPWSRGALSQIPPLWPWRPCHCWGLEGHHQGEVRSAFYEPVWCPTKHETEFAKANIIPKLHHLEEQVLPQTRRDRRACEQRGDRLQASCYRPFWSSSRGLHSTTQLLNRFFCTFPNNSFSHKATLGSYI